MERRLACCVPGVFLSLYEALQLRGGESGRRQLAAEGLGERTQRALVGG